MSPRLSEAEIEKLRVLYEESRLSVLALIRETGHSHRTIYYYAARRGWKLRAAQRGPRLPLEKIRSLYEDTIVPVAEIARLAGVAVPTVHVWAVRYGWKPRASRLRGKSASRGDGIADLDAEVAAARRRAEDVAEERKAREEERQIERTTQALGETARHARRLRPAKRGSLRAARTPPMSEAELAERRREIAETLDRVARERENQN